MASLAVALRLPLLLFRRTSQKGRKNAHDKDSDYSEDSRKLVTYNELPEWYRHQECPFILGHYRPVSDSCARSFHSLCYLHNESLNIYTHLLPAIALALALPLLQMNISRIYADAPWMDRLILTLTPMACLGTMTLSSTYHTLANHSPFVAASCLLLDFTGIFALITASFISAIYVGFYNHPFEQALYWTMIAILVTVSCLLIFHPSLHGPRFRPHRTAAFILTCLSGFAPAIHGMYVHGVHHGFHYCGVKWWLAEGFWYGLGVVFFVSRWPERWAWRNGQSGGKWGGTFDIWGSSHQVFHVCVVLGAGCHCWGVWEAWRHAVEF